MRGMRGMMRMKVEVEVVVVMLLWWPSWMCEG